MSASNEQWASLSSSEIIAKPCSLFRFQMLISIFVTTVLVLSSSPVVGFLGATVPIKKGSGIFKSQPKKGYSSPLILSAQSILAANLPDEANLPGLEDELAIFSPEFITKAELFENIRESEDAVDNIIRALKVVHVPAGVDIIKEGETGDDSMYFLADGKFDCKSDAKLLTTYKTRGDHFGELAMVFQQPRAATVTATEDSLLWKLESKDFLDNVNVPNVCKKLLKQKYKLSYAKQFDPSDLFDLVTTLSRPKKEKASFHSSLSMLAAFSYLMVILSMFSFGNFDEFGLPIFFMDPEKLPPSLLQSEFSGTLMIISSITGMIRLPRRSPRARMLTFSLITWTSISFWVVGLSNLTGLQSDLAPLDAWGWSKGIIVFPFIMSAIRLTERLNEALVCPMKEQENDPWANTRSAAVSAATVFFLLQILQSVFLFPLMDNYENFEQHAAPLFGSVEYGGIILNNCHTGIFMMGLGALVVTLVFEKKITMTQANAMTFLILGMFIYDDSRTLIAATIGYLGGGEFHSAISTVCPNLYPAFEYYIGKASENHILEAYIGVYVLTVGFSLLQIAQKQHQPDQPPSVSVESMFRKVKEKKGDITQKLMIDIALMFGTIGGVFIISLLD